MTLANQLTISRICLVPAIAILLVYGEFGWALFVIGIAAVTDALDGLFARSRHERTELGAVLDPIADKLLVTTCLIALAFPAASIPVRIPAWLAILSISRDVGIVLVVLVLTLFVGRRTFPPSVLGKATTTLHLVTILWVIACNVRGTDHPLTSYLFGATALLVVASAAHYLYTVRDVIGTTGPTG